MTNDNFQSLPNPATSESRPRAMNWTPSSGPTTRGAVSPQMAVNRRILNGTKNEICETNPRSALFSFGGSDLASIPLVGVARKIEVGA